MSDKLAVLGEIDRRLASISTVDEAKAIRDQAEAIRIYAKSARKGLSIQNRAATIKILAEQRAGALLKKVRRVPRNERPKGGEGIRATLARNEIPEVTARRWEGMAEVPEATVRGLEGELTEAGKELTSSMVLGLARSERAQEPALPVVTPGFPEGPFRTLVIDPPWPIEKIVLDRRPVEREAMDYATMTLDEIRELPIRRLADDRGAHVYLWTTHKFLPAALALFESWSVRYECLLTWIKPTAQPLWWMFNTEHVLFGKLGSLAPLVKGEKTGFTAPQQRHSHKPDEFFSLVRRVSPGPRLTMFDDQRKEFESWGVPHLSQISKQNSREADAGSR